MSLLPKSVVITDDTMREGLQIEGVDIPVSEKLRLLDALGPGVYAHQLSPWKTGDALTR